MLDLRAVYYVMDGLALNHGTIAVRQPHAAGIVVEAQKRTTRNLFQRAVMPVAVHLVGVDVLRVHNLVLCVVEFDPEHGVGNGNVAVRPQGRTQHGGHGGHHIRLRIGHGGDVAHVELVSRTVLQASGGSLPHSRLRAAIHGQEKLLVQFALHNIGAKVGMGRGQNAGLVKKGVIGAICTQHAPRALPELDHSHGQLRKRYPLWHPHVLLVLALSELRKAQQAYGVPIGRLVVALPLQFVFGVDAVDDRLQRVGTIVVVALEHVAPNALEEERLVFGLYALCNGAHAHLACGTHRCL